MHRRIGTVSAIDQSPVKITAGLFFWLFGVQASANNLPVSSKIVYRSFCRLFTVEP